MRGYIQQGATTPATNHEGYKDKTANAAVSIVMNNSKKYREGDITTMTDRNGTERVVVVLKPFDNFVVGLELRDEEFPERDHKVLVKTVMHCDTAKLINVYNDRLEGVMKTMPDDAFATLMRAVTKTLGLNPEPEVVEKETVKEVPVEVIKEVPKEVVKEVPVYKDLPDELLELPKTLQSVLESRSDDTEAVRPDNTELIRAETERDLYKQMYTDLFNRLVSSRLAS